MPASAVGEIAHGTALRVGRQRVSRLGRLEATERHCATGPLFVSASAVKEHPANTIVLALTTLFLQDPRETVATRTRR